MLLPRFTVSHKYVRQCNVKLVPIMGAGHCASGAMAPTKGLAKAVGPEPPMSSTKRVGIDASKALFTLHYVDDAGGSVLQTAFAAFRWLYFPRSFALPR